MKKVLLGLCCVMFSTGAIADSFNYSQNPILRPITLPDSMVSVSAAVGQVTEVDGSEETFLLPGIYYGVTDNFTIGFDGLTYRFYNDDGLELAANIGARDSYESDEFGDSDAGGVAVFGKKVINDNFAINFGIDLVGWDEEVLEDRSEVDYSIGLMYNIAPNWTVAANYTYRDLEDFSQDSANQYALSLMYAYSPNMDFGLFMMDSDYEEVINGHYLHNEVEQGGGIFVNWRF